MKRINIVVVIGILLSIERIHAIEVDPSGDMLWRCNLAESFAFTSEPGPAYAALTWANFWPAEIYFDPDNGCPPSLPPGISYSNPKSYGMENIVITAVVYQF
jgi:hypothetical protein